MNIRVKLLLVTLVLTSIPLVGLNYVREMEAFLREGQERSAIALARAAATALHDRPSLLGLRLGSADGRELDSAEEGPTPMPPPTQVSTVPGAPPDPAPSSSLSTPPTGLPQEAPGGRSASADPVHIPLAQSQGDRSRSTPSPAAGPAASGVVRTAPSDPDPGGMQGSAAREIELIIRGLSRAQSRIWVIDWQRNLLATAGSLRPDPDTPQEEDPPGVFEWIEVHALEPLYSKLLETPSKGLPDIVSEAGFSSGREVDSALGGIPASRWYNTSDNQIALLSAAHPIWIGEKVMGAVIVVESTLPVLSVRYRAFEQLLTATLLVFLLGAGTLFAFASRLSSRLANLRSEAESAIDPQGRVKGLVKGSNARDEIGDLARSFSTMLERLAQYNAYLERMADRLSHELRTPVAIVSSSLDNLKLQPLPDAALTYIDRAEQGLRRLNVIFTRMREASRLEQMLRDAERERFDLTHVVAGCGAGYASAFPEHRFDLELPSAPVWLTGAPDAIAQMLDKIVENAVDFSHELAPIRISVQQSFGEVLLSVNNVGPLLPATMQGQLFESMISVRDGLDASGASPHLGLGLFMVRLIAEFHHATARAENRPDGRGVIVEVTFPAEYTPEAEERPRRPPREAGLESA